MRLKFLDADDEREAAFLAAAALGPTALLVDDGGDGQGRFASLLADGVERPAAEVADFVERSLHYHDAPLDLVRRVLDRRQRQPDPTRLLTTGLKATLKFARLPKANRARLMLIGPPAAGKTTLMGKLVARGGAPTAHILSTDWDRPGGIAQLTDSMSVLGIETERLDLATNGVPPISAEQGPLLIDTAGVDADNRSDFVALGHLAQALGVEPVLVLPAQIDADEAVNFTKAALAIGTKTLLVTRLDMARRLTGLLAAAHAGLAIAGGSVTPNFAYGFKALSPTSLASYLLELALRRRPSDPSA
jgi:flagellar biosynthesis protein FlhF